MTILKKFTTNMFGISKHALIRNEKLFFYSDNNFLRKIPVERILEVEFEKLNSSAVQQHTIVVNNEEFIFCVEQLKWDSEYFNKKTYNLKFIFYSTQNYSFLCEAIEQFKQDVLSDSCYCFINIPPEDNLVIQALGESGFRLVETRLNYFNDNLSSFDFKRFKVRAGVTSDIENLKRVAHNNRNDFDRFHSDVYFSNDIADKYLGTYVEASINGFSDYVMLPDQEVSNAFLTANYQKDYWDKLKVNVAKMVLSAVDPSCKGWYVKLISEMTFHLKEQGAQVITMNTQSTNRAVIKTWEKLNYKLGSTTHVFAFQKN